MKHLKVTNMPSPRTGKPIANQFSIETPDGWYFQSYDTIIAFSPRGVICTDGKTTQRSGKVLLDVNHWNCSVTTVKYRNAFLGIDTEETKRRIDDGRILLVDLNEGF